MARATKVVQDPGDEVPREVLAKAVVEVADAAKRLLNGPLTKRAVIVLVQDACKGQVSRAVVEVVLDAASDLKRLYVR